MDNRTLFHRVASLYPVIDDLPLRDQLTVLEVTWLFIAGTARTAVYTPAHFTSEQARQIQHLRALTDLVVDDMPIPPAERERLAQARDDEIAAIVRRFQQMLGGFTN
jgi:hypothetical protein